VNGNSTTTVTGPSSSSYPGTPTTPW
jgi:hypothetical protein